MSVQKQHLKSRPECKVKFRVPKSQIENAHSVHLVGDFNDWDPSATPMDQLKSGDFTTILYLSPGQEYEFRYLVNGDTWINDQESDSLSPTPYPGVQNSVVAT